MHEKNIAIVKSDFHGKHTTSWSGVWIEYCKFNNIEYSLIDWRDYNAFRQLIGHKIILWHYSHYSSDEMLFARSIMLGLKAAGCRVYPDTGDSDHFDDKVAQSYLFSGLGLSTPKNYPLHSITSVKQWAENIGVFPVVAKLRTGSGASNVKLLLNSKELFNYANLMFGSGIDSSPNILFKIKSNIKSTQSIDVFLKRLRRVPEFLFSKLKASKFKKEQGYVYLQEYIPDVNYDLKVVVVGDRLSYVVRSVRPGDFRASGGGSLLYDRDMIDKSIIDFAFKAADTLKSDCTGFEIIKDPRTGCPLILEVSYGFSHQAQVNAGGYFDREGSWHATEFNPPAYLLERLMKEVL